MVTANVAVCGNAVYKVILSGSTISRMRNPPVEWLFHRELLAQGLGSHGSNGFSTEITSSLTMNPPWRNGFPVGYRKLIDADSGRQDQNARKILQTVTILGTIVPNCTLPKLPTFLNLNVKTQIK
jgi:hypothetical protein